MPGWPNPEGKKSSFVPAHAERIVHRPGQKLVKTSPPSCFLHTHVLFTFHFTIDFKEKPHFLPIPDLPTLIINHLHEFFSDPLHWISLPVPDYILDYPFIVIVLQ